MKVYRTRGGRREEETGCNVLEFLNSKPPIGEVRNAGRLHLLGVSSTAPAHAAIGRLELRKGLSYLLVRVHAMHDDNGPVALGRVPQVGRRGGEEGEEGRELEEDNGHEKESGAFSNHGIPRTEEVEELLFHWPRSPHLFLICTTRWGKSIPFPPQTEFS